VLSCCTRSFLSQFPRHTLEVESGRTGAALDATLAPLLDNGFLSWTDVRRPPALLMNIMRYIGPLSASLTPCLNKRPSSVTSSRQPTSSRAVPSNSSSSNPETVT
jgi:hypothetical protein